MKRWLIVGLLILCLLSMPTALAEVITVKDATTIFIPPESTKITYEPLPVHAKAVLSEPSTTDPSKLGEVVKFNTVVRKGWYPARLVQYSRTGDDAKGVLIKANKPFEAWVDFKVTKFVSCGGGFELYFNSYKIFESKCKCKRWGCWEGLAGKLYIKVLPDGKSMKVVAYYNGKKVLDKYLPENEKQYILKVSIPGYVWWTDDWRHNHILGSIHINLLEYEYYSKPEEILKGGYYLKITKKLSNYMCSVYTQSVRSCPPSHVLYKSNGPFEYSVNFYSYAEFSGRGTHGFKLYINNIDLGYIASKYSYHYWYFTREFSAHITFKLLPKDGRLYGYFYRNGHLVTVRDLSFLKPPYVLVLKPDSPVSRCYEFKITNPTVTNYEYLGNGKLIKLDVGRYSIVPLPDAQNAKIYAVGYSKVYKCWKKISWCGCWWWWGCWCTWTTVCGWVPEPDPNAVVKIQSINTNEDKVYGSIINAGSLDLSKANALKITVYRGDGANVYIVPSGVKTIRNNIIGNKLIFYFPLTEKHLTVDASTKKTLDLSSYLAPNVINPVVVIPSRPIKLTVPTGSIVGAKVIKGLIWYAPVKVHFSVDTESMFTFEYVNAFRYPYPIYYMKIYKDGKLIKKYEKPGKIVLPISHGNYEVVIRGLPYTEYIITIMPNKVSDFRAYIPDSIVKITRATYTFSENEIGTNTIVAEASNAYGLKDKDVVKVTVEPIDKPPVVKITKPISDVVKPGEVTIEAVATDDKGLTYGKLIVEGKTIQYSYKHEEVLSGTKATFSAKLNLKNGVYTIKATAIDNAGNKGKATMTLYVRNVKLPKIVQIKILTPDRNGRTYTFKFDGAPGGTCADAGVYTADSYILLEATVVRGDYNIAYIRWGEIDNIEDRPQYNPCLSYNLYKFPSVWWYGGQITNVPSSSSYTFQFKMYVPPSWGAGGTLARHAIWVMVCDVKGFCNFEKIEIIGIDIDDSPPKVRIIRPSSGATLKGTITLEAQSSDDKGVKSVYFWLYNKEHSYSLGDADLTSGSSSWGYWALSYDFSKIAPGTYTLEAIARDYSGHTGVDKITVNIRSITVTLTPTPTPTPTLTPTPTPTPVCKLNAEITKWGFPIIGCYTGSYTPIVEYSASATGCKISKVKAYIDGSLVYTKTLTTPVISVKDSITLSKAAELSNGDHTFKLVVKSNTGVTKTITKTFKVCRPVPTPTPTIIRPLPKIKSIDVYEVTLNGLEWIAGGYNGKVYIFGYYDPGTGTLVLYKQVRPENMVANYYKILQSKTKIGKYEFEEGKFTVKKNGVEYYAGTLILTKSPYCTASIVNNEGISYKPSCSS